MLERLLGDVSPDVAAILDATLSGRELSRPLQPPGPSGKPPEGSGSSPKAVWEHHPIRAAGRARTRRGRRGPPYATPEDFRRALRKRRG